MGPIQDGAKRSSPVILFARNKLCALVRPGLVVTPASLLDRLLDSDVKLGTSTPKADPTVRSPTMEHAISGAL